MFEIFEVLLHHDLPADSQRIFLFSQQILQGVTFLYAFD